MAVFTVYPLMKRFTFFAHFGVGCGLALAPLGGYVGMVNQWPEGGPIWLLSIFTLFWVAGFDILYAIDDLEFDRREGLNSVPSRFGEKAAREAAKTLHYACIGILLGMAVMLLPGVVSVEANVFERSAEAMRRGFDSPSGWRHLLLFVSSLPAVVLLVLQQKFSNSLEPGSVFFKVNAWTGVAVFVLVLAGAWQ